MARDWEKKREMLSFIKYGCMSQPEPTLSNRGAAGCLLVSRCTSEKEAWQKKKKPALYLTGEKYIAKEAWQEAVCGPQQCHKHSTSQHYLCRNFVLLWKSFSSSTPVIFLSAPMVILAVWMHHLLEGSVWQNKIKGKTKCRLIWRGVCTLCVFAYLWTTCHCFILICCMKIAYSQ